MTIAEKIVEDMKGDFPAVEWLPKGYYEFQKRAESEGELVGSSDWDDDVPSMFPASLYLFNDHSALSISEKGFSTYSPEEMRDLSRKIRGFQEKVLEKPKDLPEDNQHENWSKTVDEAVSQLMSELSETDKTIIKNAKQENLVWFHLGLGTRIRDNFGLNKGNSLLLESCGSKSMHPDEASMVIIKKLWKLLQAEPDE